MGVGLAQPCGATSPSMVPQVTTLQEVTQLELLGL